MHACLFAIKNRITLYYFNKFCKLYKKNCAFLYLNICILALQNVNKIIPRLEFSLESITAYKHCNIVSRLDLKKLIFKNSLIVALIRGINGLIVSKVTNSYFEGC